MAYRTGAAIVAAATLAAAPALAQDSGDASELAQKLANPIAALISVPIQLNWDQNLGPNEDGQRVVANVQPVVPITLNANWNLISRTILPVVWQEGVVPGEDGETGLGDTVQSLFLSPAAPVNGVTWGVGPVFQLPTATKDGLGAGKLGLGPTGVVLRQDGPWTYGFLANHVWSVAGEGGRPDVSATFLQPFVAYTTPAAWTFSLNAESSYDWEREDWAVPVNAQVTKVFDVGGQKVSAGGGLRYWIESSEGGPEGLGVRAVMTFLFPRGR